MKKKWKSFVKVREVIRLVNVAIDAQKAIAKLSEA